MRGDGAAGEPRAGSPDRALWRRSVAIDVAEDEAEHFLDLAGYAEDRLDPDERDRIAERLAKDPMAAADVAGGRAPPGRCRRPRLRAGRRWHAAAWPGHSVSEILPAAADAARRRPLDRPR